MEDFAEATKLERVDESLWRAVLNEDWALWGPSGGYLTGLVLRAAGEASDLTRPVSLSCQFLRIGKFESVDIRVASLRKGKRSEALRVDLEQSDQCLLTALVWISDDGSEAMEHDHAKMAGIPNPDALPSYQEVYPGRPQHPFTRRFEHKPIDPVPDGDMTAREPELTSLFRFTPRAISPDPFVDACRAMVLLDTFAWLATYPAQPTEGASPWIAPNLDFYYRFHRPTVDADWLYMKTRADLAHNSLIAVGGEIRDLSGDLLVSGASQLLCRPRPEKFR